MKTRNASAILTGFLIFCFASIIGGFTHTVVRDNVAKPYTLPKTYAVDTVSKNYSVTTANNNVSVRERDIATNNVHNYNVNLSDSVKKLKTTYDNTNSSQKLYQMQNKELISQASKAYGFIIANDYKLVKYCSQYYPVKTLKKKYDARFSAKKNKAETILNKAFGSTGAKEFANALVSNPDFIKVAQAQIENDYQAVKHMAAQDGVKNFSRYQYCKMMEEQADFAVQTDYKNFTTIFPNF